MATVNNNIQILLADQADRKELVTNQYIKNSRNENYAYICRKFFDGDESILQYLNTSSGIFQSVSRTIANYSGTPDWDLDFFISKSWSDYVALGYFTLGIAQEDGERKLIYLPSENYAEVNKVHTMYRFYMDDTKDFDQYYVLITEYYTGRTENKLYQMNGPKSLDTLIEVPLDTRPETANLLPVEQTGLPYPAIVVIKEDLMDQKPLSMADMIKDIVYSLDRKTMLFETQFLKNVESFILTKNIARPMHLLEKYQNGVKIRFADLPRVLRTSDEQGSIEFVNNTNDLIGDAMEYEKSQIARISAITSIPMDFLGIGGAHGSIGQGSRGLLHGSFVKMIANFRKMFDMQMKDIYADIASFNGFDADVYTRPDVFPKTDNELVMEIKAAREAGVVSQQKGISMYQGIEMEEAEEEFERIRESSLVVTTIDGSENEQDSGEDQGQENSDTTRE